MRLKRYGLWQKNWSVFFRQEFSSYFTVGISLDKFLYSFTLLKGFFKRFFFFELKYFLYTSYLMVFVCLKFIRKKTFLKKFKLKRLMRFKYPYYEPKFKKLFCKYCKYFLRENKYKRFLLYLIRLKVLKKLINFNAFFINAFSPFRYFTRIKRFNLNFFKNVFFRINFKYPNAQKSLIKKPLKFINFFKTFKRIKYNKNLLYLFSRKKYLQYLQNSFLNFGSSYGYIMIYILFFSMILFKYKQNVTFDFKKISLYNHKYLNFSTFNKSSCFNKYLLKQLDLLKVEKFKYLWLYKLIFLKSNVTFCLYLNNIIRSEIFIKSLSKILCKKFNKILIKISDRMILFKYKQDVTFDFKKISLYNHKYLNFSTFNK